MQIFIETGMGEDFWLEVEQGDSLIMLKEEIYRMTRIAPDNQMLGYKDQVLTQENMTMSDYNIQEGSIIHLYWDSSSDGSSGSSMF